MPMQTNLCWEYNQISTMTFEAKIVQTDVKPESGASLRQFENETLELISKGRGFIVIQPWTNFSPLYSHTPAT